MSGIVLFQVKVRNPEDISGPFVEFEKIKNVLSFSTSGFVVENYVVTATCYLDLILDIADFHLVNVTGQLERPNTNGCFYFNHSGDWVPVQVFRVVKLQDENLAPQKFFLIYFKSDFPLPAQIKDCKVFSSPLGLLSIPLYLNQTSAIDTRNAVDGKIGLVRFSHFPGTEGSYCNGRLLIPSIWKGFCLSLPVPKL